MGRLTGKTAIVTGAASGIGKGIVECFTAEGARVAVVDMNFSGAMQVASVQNVLRQAACMPIQADVTSDEEVGQMVRVALEAFGHVDILVNNAGMAGEIGDPFTQNTIGNLQKVFDTNTASAFRTVLALWNHFTERKSGNIINIASIVAHFHGALNMKPAYNVSKAGLVSLTKTLAYDLAPYGVRVNSISPGLLYTGFWQHLGDQLRKERPEQYPPGVEIHEVFLKRVKELVPLGRPQTPEDVGLAAAFLASDDAKNITGVDLPVDGGVLAR